MLDISTQIDQLFKRYSEAILGFTLCIVCNKKSTSTLSDEMSSEYLSNSEFEEVVSMFSSLDMDMEFFLNEDDFMKFILNDKSLRKFVVYNAAQSGKGAGRKSLIPSFCNLHRIPVTGSNAHVVSLCRHKYHTNKLLSAGGFPVPDSWLYANGIQDSDVPHKNQKIILKPLYESSSIGIDDDSVIFFNHDHRTQEIIIRKQESLDQPIMLQQFIEGYEAEIPVLSYMGKVICFAPVGISLSDDPLMGDSILNYESVYFDQYHFYSFELVSKACKEMIEIAKRVSFYLGIEGLGRIDFRICRNGKFYITDVSTNPHFVRHSSIYHAFQKIGMQDNDIARAIVCGALSKTSTYYASDQN